MAGFVLNRQDAAGKWGAATFCLTRAAGEAPVSPPPEPPLAEVADEVWETTI